MCGFATAKQISPQKTTCDVICQVTMSQVQTDELNNNCKS